MTAGPSTPSSPQSWVSHSLPDHRAGGAFCSLARELRAFLPHIPAAQSPPCCPAPAQPVPGTRSSASTAGEHPARAPCSLPWLWQAGGTAGGSEGSVLPRQQLHIPQGLQKFPPAFVPQELHTSAQLQARLLPENCEGALPSQALLGSFPNPGCVRDHGSSWRVPTLRGALGQQEGSCPPKLTSHITAKKKVQKPLLSALLVQLICFGVCFYQRAGLATAAMNLIKHFNRVYKY